MVAYKAISLIGSLVSLSFLTLLLVLGQIIAAIGVWQMKQWGRRVFLVLMIIGVSLSLLEIVAYNQQFSASYIIATLLGTIVDCLFLYWLATHGDRFRA